jgi:hypothetical protein
VVVVGSDSVWLLSSLKVEGVVVLPPLYAVRCFEDFVRNKKEQKKHKQSKWQEKNLQEVSRQLD